jgi:hypothetical protein
MLNFVVPETKICFPLAVISPVDMCALNLYSGHTVRKRTGLSVIPTDLAHNITYSLEENTGRVNLLRF